ncbi:hypothetical protein NC652_021642 [Populus alba x Populus x berolinensis]|nr:hypothetical protein NC652_021642 [Populus alba x Populus x berolinensis]
MISLLDSIWISQHFVIRENRVMDVCASDSKPPCCVSFTINKQSYLVIYFRFIDPFSHVSFRFRT